MRATESAYFFGGKSEILRSFLRAKLCASRSLRGSAEILSGSARARLAFFAHSQSPWNHRDVYCLHLVMEYHAIAMMLRFENSLHSNRVAVAHCYGLLSVNEDRTAAGKTSQCKSHFLTAIAGRRFFKQCTHHSLERNALVVKFRRICGDRADIGFCRIACAGQKQQH